jgi:uncharacterized metal-binding protein YceD (DUF177 family)
MQIDITAAKKIGQKLRLCLEYKPDNKLINNPLASFAGKRNSAAVIIIMTATYMSGENQIQKNYPCDRCSQNVRYNGLADFDDVFYGSGGGDYVISGCIIDFTKAADDAIMLDIPHKILCGEDCKGYVLYAAKTLTKANADALQ